MIVVEWEKYSTWKRLIGLYTWWIRYKFNLRFKVKRVSPPPERQTKNLTADDFKDASYSLCKIAQIESFNQEYKDLQASWALSSKSPLLPLCPLLTEGIVRVGGHLDKAPIPFEARHQNILCPGCWFKTFKRNTSTWEGNTHWLLCVGSSGSHEGNHSLERQLMTACTAKGEGRNQKHL